jgi:hypothetical protein
MRTIELLTPSLQSMTSDATEPRKRRRNREHVEASALTSAASSNERADSSDGLERRCDQSPVSRMRSKQSSGSDNSEADAEHAASVGSGVMNA